MAEPLTREIMEELLDTAFDKKLDPILRRLDCMEALQARMEVLQANSCAELHDALVPVPLREGTMPNKFPPTLGSLLVGGSELAVSTKQVSNWSRDDSLDVIREYDSGYVSAKEQVT